MSPMRTSLVILSVCLLSDSGSGAGAGTSDNKADGVRTDVRNLTRKAGEGVKFHCDVHSDPVAGASIPVVWRRGYTVMSTGTILLSRDNRLSVANNGHNLHITAVRHNDTGEYVCQITSQAGEVLEQTHRLQVVVPPTIAADQSRLTGRLGEGVVLRCHAHGSPAPTIHWYKSVGGLAGEVGCDGSCLTLTRLSLAMGGDYLCSASNGVGHPAHANIHVTVLFGPEVLRVGQVTTDPGNMGQRKGHGARLECEVSGSPSPRVTWYRGDTRLEPSTKHVAAREEVGGHVTRHVMAVSHVGDGDYGNYSCEANNTVGSDRGYVELHGRPSTPIFSESKHGNFLAWSVASAARVDSYRVLFRQENTTGWLSETIPRDLDEKTFIQNMVWVMKNTSAVSARYDCIVQAHNKHGWSAPSTIQTYYHDTERDKLSKSWMMSVFSGEQSLMEDTAWASIKLFLVTLMFLLG